MPKGLFGEGFRGQFFTGECAVGYVSKIVLAGVRIPVQDYQSLRPAVMI